MISADVLGIYDVTQCITRDLLTAKKIESVTVSR